MLANQAAAANNTTARAKPTRPAESHAASLEAHSVSPTGQGSNGAAYRMASWNNPNEPTVTAAMIRPLIQPRNGGHTRSSSKRDPPRSYLTTRPGMGAKSVR